MSSKQNITLTDETLSIASPISTVFAFLSNHENYIAWYPGVVSVTAEDRLPPGTVGKVYNETLRLPSGRHRAFDITVVESRAPELFMTEGTLAPVHPRMEMRLTATSAQETTLNLKFLSRNPSALGRFLIHALVARAVRRQSKAGLLKLKSLLE